MASGPAHGTLSGSGANLTYTPAANYNGPDSFSYVANDGATDIAFIEPRLRHIARQH